MMRMMVVVGVMVWMNGRGAVGWCMVLVVWMYIGNVCEGDELACVVSSLWSRADKAGSSCSDAEWEGVVYTITSYVLA